MSLLRYNYLKQRLFVTIAKRQPGYPHLNGQNEQYLFNAMKAYQNNERAGAYAKMMKHQLSVMQGQDLADIAAFYSKGSNNHE